MPSTVTPRRAKVSVSRLRTALRALHEGDFSVRLEADNGIEPGIAEAFNAVAERNEHLSAELTRLAGAGGQARVKGVAGTWKDLTHSVNSMAANLTSQVRNIADVTTAVARGDLSKKITVDVKGEILELKNTINTMVDQLSTFASEVTRVA